MTKYLVWIPSTLGPIAQIWFGKQTDGNGKDKETLAIHELTEDECKIGIRALAEKYSYE